ncbi:MAG TPA: CsbD family protein [Sphingomicrobium sp.]|nr:CsbD family protein [Sphingomicrobium sp.]
MNDHDTHEDMKNGIDHDRTEGSMKEMGGKMKEGAGKLFGDAKMKHEGEADQAEGKLQNMWGGMKDEAREAGDEADRSDDDR